MARRALLALAVAAVHVADQGGITSLASPCWIGWRYWGYWAGPVSLLLEAALVVLSASMLLALRRSSSGD